MTGWLGRLLGIEGLDSVSDVHVRFASEWAQQSPLLLLFGCVLLAGAAVAFYFRFERGGRRWARILMTGLRVVVLVGLLLILAEPVISMTITRHPRPVLLMLFDGSESMAIEDKLADAERERIARALGADAADEAERLALLRRAIHNECSDVLDSLARRFRLRAHALDGKEPREVDCSTPSDDALDAGLLSGKLTAEGRGTALGTGLDWLRTRYGSSAVAGG